MENAILRLSDILMGKVESDASVTVDDRTRISWGVVVALVTAIFTIATLSSGAVWWAGNFAGGVNTQLSTIQQMLKDAGSEDQRQGVKIADLERRLGDLDAQLKAVSSTGTPGMLQRMRDAEAKLTALDEALKIQAAVKAATGGGK